MRLEAQYRCGRCGVVVSRELWLSPECGARVFATLGITSLSKRRTSDAVGCLCPECMYLTARDGEERTFATGAAAFRSKGIGVLTLAVALVVFLLSGSMVSAGAQNLHGELRGEVVQGLAGDGLSLLLTGLICMLGGVGASLAGIHRFMARVEQPWEVPGTSARAAGYRKFRR